MEGHCYGGPSLGKPREHASGAANALLDLYPRSGTGRAMYERILVPIDGSEGSQRAIEHALELATRDDAELYGLHVVDTRKCGEPALSSLELVVDEAEDEGHQLLDAFAERAAGADIAVTTRCVHGIPHETILDHAREVDADLIVLGYEGEDHTRHMGSVARDIVDTSDRPVHTT